MTAKMSPPLYSESGVAGTRTQEELSTGARRNAVPESQRNSVPVPQKNLYPMTAYYKEIKTKVRIKRRFQLQESKKITHR